MSPLTSRTRAPSGVLPSNGTVGRVISSNGGSA